MKSKIMSFIVITGNPVDGFQYYGRFSDEPTAIDWADENLSEEDWWVAELINPDRLKE